MRVYVRTPGGARPFRQNARPHGRAPIMHAKQVEPSEHYRPVTDLTSKVGDASCVQRHAAALERTPEFHPSNPGQKVRVLTQLQQTYGNGFVQRLLQRERSRFDVPLPPRRPVRLPPIPPPPIPETPQLPRRCPTTAAARRQIRENNIAGQTERRMRYTVNLERARASVHRPIQLTRALIRRADRAIRAEFRRLLPAGRDFKARHAITARTPAAFARLRIPNAQRARRRLAEIALKTEPDTLRQLCITQPTHSLLQSQVANPLFGRLGIGFVREYERARIGGQTTHTYSGGRWSQHVDIPSRHRHMGHILVHEAMHYYVNGIYFATASRHALEQQLLEGGAEFLARHVIHQRLARDPAFRINYGTYSSEFGYVNNNLLRGGLSSFARAYFQGHVDLLGLTPRTTP